ncbi:MAG: SHOCT domain-containing protein, partial [Pseudomonadota bacterium]
MQRIVTASLLITSLALGGCVFAPGGPDGWDGERDEPTIGQQLIDLDRARDSGLISDAEFERTDQSGLTLLARAVQKFERQQRVVCCSVGFSCGDCRLKPGLQK